MTIGYTKGLEPRETDVTWTDDGGPLDLTGATLELDVFQYGGSSLITKTTGLVGRPPRDVLGNAQANLIITWATLEAGTEIGVLPAGRYVVHFKAVVNGATYDLFDELVVSPPVANRGYCDATDLMLAGITSKPSWNPYDQINRAADEINALVGQRYELPLILDSAPEFVHTTLRMMNAKLASGRYLLENAGNNDKNVHAYGAMLVKEAIDFADAIADGAFRLVGVPGLVGSNKASAPSIRHRDSESLVEGFEEFAHRSDWDKVIMPGPFKRLPPFGMESDN